jgi:hypothetical protein
MVSMLAYRRCRAGERAAAAMPIAGWMPLARPAAAFASASFAHAS